MPAKKKAAAKKVTRYTHDELEPRTPETGHTNLLPDEEQVVEVPMDNGWTQALDVGKLDDERSVVIDMEPTIDPVLLWAGKSSRREVPVLPLQRNEIVSESRISRIVERARARAKEGEPEQLGMFAGLERDLREGEKDKRVEFYTHEEGWKNKLICGDSLPVMESLIRYEGLANSIRMVYLDPPYGIGYNSNFQQEVTSNSNTAGDTGDDVLTIKAFNDTWALGTHSYMSYLQHRAYLIRELLTQDGSLFVQCSVAHMHRIRLLLDEVFGPSNCASVISWKKAAPDTAFLKNAVNYILWYVKDANTASKHVRKVYRDRQVSDGSTEDPRKLALWGDFPDGASRTLTTEEKRDPSLLPEGTRVFRVDKLTNKASAGNKEAVTFEGQSFAPPRGYVFKTNPEGMRRLIDSGRVIETDSGLSYKFYLQDNPVVEITNLWEDTAGKIVDMVYVVQTNEKIVARCMSMATNPGDIVLDPTCGSGTTAAVAERLGRRWVTVDTSRVAMNVARRRLLSAVFDHYEMMGEYPAAGLRLETVEKQTMSSIAEGMEPEVIERADRPIVDKTAVRVVGPFELMTLGRYSLEDWNGYLLSDDAGVDSAKVENYVEVVCRLYRPGAEVGGGTGFVHAVAQSEDELLAISVGPLTGRVTARQIYEAAKESSEQGIHLLHVLGWAFEANVGEELKALKDSGEVDVVLQMIRPDALVDGLKIVNPDALFSPLALPELEVSTLAGGATKIVLKGVGLFDRRTKSTSYHDADDGYIAAWYLDEDYDGDCFVDCQMFFDFKRVPKLDGAAGGPVDAGEFTLAFASEPFKPGKYKRIAVKVVDIFGNESTVVRGL